MQEPSIVILACDQHLAGIYGKKMQRAGWIVNIAEDIEEAEKKASKVRPQILLIDTSCVADILIEMKRLRSLPTLLKTKIALMTDKADKKMIEAARNAGASGFFIFGHFSPHDIVQNMRKLIQ
ncbi:MAG: response regulator [Patescibacteria group bacterium]|nr:response regulator [Patescibacteria group bacterium]